jgi:hypothetical protein
MWPFDVFVVCADGFFEENALKMAVFYNVCFVDTVFRTISEFVVSFAIIRGMGFLDFESVLAVIFLFRFLPESIHNYHI